MPYVNSFLYWRISTRMYTNEQTCILQSTCKVMYGYLNKCGGGGFIAFIFNANIDRKKYEFSLECIVLINKVLNTLIVSYKTCNLFLSSVIKKTTHKCLLKMTMLNEYKTCNIQFLTVIIYRIR